MAHHNDASRIADLLAKLGNDGTKELFRRLLEQALHYLIDAELCAQIGAGRHERSDSRSNYRNGGRTRMLSTPAGDVELRIPKVRVGSFFPSLLEPRRRVDKALWAVIMTAYITGTSTCTVFAQPDADTTRDQLDHVVGMLEACYPGAAEVLAGAADDVTAYATFPRGHWSKIASTNPLERVHQEIKRRSNVIGIFPDDASVIRLVGAVLVEVHDDWQTTDRRYLSEGSMRHIDHPPPKEVTPTQTPQLPAAQSAGSR
jgi:putative transposase